MPDETSKEPRPVDPAEVDEEDGELLPPRDVMSLIRAPGEPTLPPPELPPDLG